MNGETAPVGHRLGVGADSVPPRGPLGSVRPGEDAGLFVNTDEQLLQLVCKTQRTRTH